MFHYSKKPFVLNREIDYSGKYDDDSGMTKPYGLWISVGDSWERWCQDSEFNVGALKHKTEIDFNQANVLNLDTIEKVHLFYKKYRENGYVDWVSVSNDYSGVSFNPYFIELRRKYIWYNIIDVPSVCIWDLSIIRNIQE